MTIDEMLERARRGLHRLEPHAAAAAVRDGALLVDIRPEAQRRSEGAIPGALVIERNVLEWRLDPVSPWRIAEAGDPDRHVVVVCAEGYSSSLAAASLQELGLWRATDLVGGFQAWAAAGLPTCAAGPGDGTEPVHPPVAAKEPNGALETPGSGLLTLAEAARYAGMADERMADLLRDRRVRVVPVGDVVLVPAAEMDRLAGSVD